MNTTYVYKRTEFSPYCLYTVGYYDPDGKWQPESDHEKEDDAAKRTAYLNGGNDESVLIALKKAIEIIDRLCEDYASIAGHHANYTNGEAKIIESPLKKQP